MSWVLPIGSQQSKNENGRDLTLSPFDTCVRHMFPRGFISDSGPVYEPIFSTVSNAQHISLIFSKPFITVRSYTAFHASRTQVVIKAKFCSDRVRLTSPALFKWAILSR